MRTLILFFVVTFLFACSERKELPGLIPDKKNTAPNYWCTWYWQNYLILKGQDVTNPDPATVYTNEAAREQLNEETVFGKQGMARIMLPETRGDFFFLIDHGWQDKNVKKDPFFSLIMDTHDFPRYADLSPKDRIKKFNEDIKALGWRGLGLWVRGNPSEKDMRRCVEWSKYAGIEYWKIDGGDTQHFYAEKIKKQIYPELTLEYVTGAGPLTPLWNKPGLKTYPSDYDPELNPRKSEKMLEILTHADVFRTYDAAPLLVSATTMQRIHDILSQSAGNEKYISLLNIQDDCNIAAAMGLVVAVKRHPMKTPRMYKGKDFHLQIAGDRHVDKRLNEMDRFVRWQRIAQPMPAGYGTYNSSDIFLTDSIVFTESDTWLKSTHGKMVRQSAPAVMARNIDLPEVSCEGAAPYVLASRFPDGAVCIATEGRVAPGNSWFYPRADIILKGIELNKPVGIFGYYKTLTLDFGEPLPDKIDIYAQDILADKAVNITKEITVTGNTVIIPGKLIEKIGTDENEVGDISVPGMVLKVIRD